MYVLSVAAVKDLCLHSQSEEVISPQPNQIEKKLIFTRFSCSMNDLLIVDSAKRGGSISPNSNMIGS